MISSSQYWKAELKKTMFDMAKFRQLKKYGEVSFLKFEKALFNFAFIIRKLDEAKKIPSEILDQKVKILTYTFKGDGKAMNYFFKVADYQHEIEIEKSRRFILDQIIHSFSVLYSYDDLGTFEGILVNSDRTKEKWLLFLPLYTILELLLLVIEGDLTQIKYSLMVKVKITI